MRNPNLSKHEAPSVTSIRKAAVELLDKESIFADPRLTRSKHRVKQDREEKTKYGRKTKKGKALFDESDSDETDTEESDCEMLESGESDSSSNSDSSSDDSEDERRRKKRSPSRLEPKTKKKSSRHEPKSKSGKHPKNPKESQAHVDLGYPKGGVVELTDHIRVLELMLGQAAKPKPNVPEEFARTMDMEEEPSNSRVMNLMKFVMKELEDHRNDTQMLLDQRQTPSQRRFNEMPPRCFFCKHGETHACGATNCPDAQMAVREGMCIFRDGRIYMADGAEMPRTHPGESLLGAVRSTANPQPAATRNNNMHPPRVAFAQVIEPESAEYDSDDEALDASPSLWHHIMAAD